jgi:NAD(P)-dependent dehydrogenase (short-subunit alcohol dehydrogenase family)
LGSPTVLVNNAATAITGLPLVSTSPTDIVTPAQATKTLTVNTLSHFNTLAALLPYLTASEAGGHVVTVSSILAHLAPASLPDYTASKAAVLSIHQTLLHELRKAGDQKVKSLLVETGQLDTPLFASTSLPFYARFFGPLLEAKDVAKEIVRTIEGGRGGVIRMPFYAKCMPFYGVLPGTLQLAVRWFSGIDGAISGAAAESK